MNLQSLLAYQNFKATRGDLKTLYPCCGFDFSPSEIFSDVTYVDIEQGIKNQAEKRGINFFVSDIFEFSFNPELVILINPSVSAKKVIEKFSPKFIICNDLHGSVGELKTIPNYEMTEMLAVDFWLFEKKN